MSAVHVAKLEYDASGPAPAQGVPETQDSKWAKFPLILLLVLNTAGFGGCFLFFSQIDSLLL